MKIEVCCGSFSDALAAQIGGANRIELCSSLFFGGLTPSLGSFLAARELSGIELAVMVRPREGGFCYSDCEFDVMLRDAEQFINNGADGIVFGCLSPDGSIDEQKTAKLCALASGKCDAVFHKAFDVCKGTLENSLSILQRLGVNRILTSGKRKTAILGSENIARLVRLSGGSIEIMAGGGVRLHNIKELFEKTGCHSIHTSALEVHLDNTSQHDEILFTGSTLPGQFEYSTVSMQKIADFTAGVRKLKI